MFKQYQLHLEVDDVYYLMRNRYSKWMNNSRRNNIGEYLVDNIDHHDRIANNAIRKRSSNVQSNQLNIVSNIELPTNSSIANNASFDRNRNESLGNTSELSASQDGMVSVVASSGDDDQSLWAFGDHTQYASSDYTKSRLNSKFPPQTISIDTCKLLPHDVSAEEKSLYASYLNNYPEDQVIGIRPRIMSHSDIIVHFPQPT